MNGAKSKSLMIKKIWGFVLASVLGVFIVAGIISSNIVEIKIEEKDEAIKYASKITYDSNLREGTREVKQVGKNGLKKVTYKVSYKGGKEVGREKQKETIVEDSVDELVTVGAKKYYLCSNGVEYETSGEKDECEKKIAWEKKRDDTLRTCNNDNTKRNCWYDSYPGTTLHWENVRSSSGRRVGAICRDGWRSSATGRGACSHHGGVSQWLYD